MVVVTIVVAVCGTMVVISTVLGIGDVEVAGVVCGADVADREVVKSFIIQLYTALASVPSIDQVETGSFGREGVEHKHSWMS